MCEVDVSAIWNENCPTLSASAAELGRNAGKITWANCIELAKRLPLVTDDNRQDARDHFCAYGAWDEDEIAAWSDTDLSAMIWQEAAADMREYRELCKGDLAKYEALVEQGQISGRLSLGTDTATIYLGS